MSDSTALAKRDPNVLPLHPLVFFLYEYGAYFGLRITKVEPYLADLMMRSSGVHASFWLEMQKEYDEADARINPPTPAKPRRH